MLPGVDLQPGVAGEQVDRRVGDLDRAGEGEQRQQPQHRAAVGEQQQHGDHAHGHEQQRRVELVERVAGVELVAGRASQPRLQPRRQALRGQRADLPGGVRQAVVMPQRDGEHERLAVCRWRRASDPFDRERREGATVRLGLGAIGSIDSGAAGVHDDAERDIGVPKPVGQPLDLCRLGVAGQLGGVVLGLDV